jgi:hypothetical protein
MKKVIKISEAHKLVKNFAKGNSWSDEPNIDKFDHLHEELVEMSKHLRYKNSKEMKEYIIKSITIDSFIKYQNGNLVIDFNDPNKKIDLTKYQNTKIF